MLHACRMTESSLLTMLHNAIEGLLRIRHRYQPQSVEGIVSTILEEGDAEEVAWHVNIGGSQSPQAELLFSRV
jgi:hypothetical protein